MKTNSLFSRFLGGSVLQWAKTIDREMGEGEWLELSNGKMLQALRKNGNIELRVWDQARKWVFVGTFFPIEDADKIVYLILKMG